MGKYTYLAIAALCAAIALLGTWLGYGVYRRLHMPAVPLEASEAVTDVSESVAENQQAAYPNGVETTPKPNTDISRAADRPVEQRAEEEVGGHTDTDSAHPHQYVLSLLDGYVTVFYASAEDAAIPGYGTHVKEITGTPVNALSKEEQQRLAMGIYIFNDEQLARILQDYGS